MAEKLELPINPSQLQVLKLGSISIDDFINEIFKDQQHHTQMCLALREYHRNDGGSPEIDVFTIVNAVFNANESTGRFRTVFKIRYHYTCSDVRNTANDTIDWNFKIEKDLMLLTGEEPWVREGDEF